MMIDIDELANQIHVDVFDVAKTGIPLGVFPNVFQKIAFELVNYENFNLEYTVAIMLSAFNRLLPLHDIGWQARPWQDSSSRLSLFPYPRL